MSSSQSSSIQEVIPIDHEDDQTETSLPGFLSKPNDGKASVSVPPANLRIQQDLELLRARELETLLNARDETECHDRLELLFKKWQANVTNAGVAKNNQYADSAWQLRKFILSLLDRTRTPKRNLRVCEDGTVNELQMEWLSKIGIDPSLQVGLGILRWTSEPGVIAGVKQWRLLTKWKQRGKDLQKEFTNAREGARTDNATKGSSSNLQGADPRATNDRVKRPDTGVGDTPVVTKDLDTLSLSKTANINRDLNVTDDNGRASSLGPKYKRKGDSSRTTDDSKDTRKDREGKTDSYSTHTEVEAERLLLKRRRLELKAEIEKKQLDRSEKDKQRKHELRKMKLAMEEKDRAKHQQRMKEFARLLSQFGESLLQKEKELRESS